MTGNVGPSNSCPSLARVAKDFVFCTHAAFRFAVAFFLHRVHGSRQTECSFLIYSIYSLSTPLLQSDKIHPHIRKLTFDRKKKNIKLPFRRFGAHQFLRNVVTTYIYKSKSIINIVKYGCVLLYLTYTCYV